MTVRTNGPALRVIRERSGLSVRGLLVRLAEDHGVAAHEDHIRNVETGARNAGPELITAIASVLRVPVVALIAETGDTRTKAAAQ